MRFLSINNIEKCLFFFFFFVKFIPWLIFFRSRILSYNDLFRHFQFQFTINIDLFIYFFLKKTSIYLDIFHILGPPLYPFDTHLETEARHSRTESRHVIYVFFLHN
jgi:hypothetical protein